MVRGELVGEKEEIGQRIERRKRKREAKKTDMDESKEKS